jgi:hypothetical protein
MSYKSSAVGNSGVIRASLLASVARGAVRCSEYCHQLCASGRWADGTGAAKLEAASRAAVGFKAKTELSGIRLVERRFVSAHLWGRRACSNTVPAGFAWKGDDEVTARHLRHALPHRLSCDKDQAIMTFHSAHAVYMGVEHAG